MKCFTKSIFPALRHAPTAVSLAFRQTRIPSSQYGGNNATTFNLSFITPQTGKAVSLVEGGTTMDLVVTTSGAPTREPTRVSYNPNTSQRPPTLARVGWTLETKTNMLFAGLSPNGWTSVL